MDRNCPREPAYAYVDPDTFFPVEMHEVVNIIALPRGPVVSFRVVMRVVTFEYLPRTAPTARSPTSRRNTRNMSGP